MRTRFAAAALTALLAASMPFGGCAQTETTSRTGPLQPSSSNMATEPLPVARPAPVTTQRIGAELLAGMSVPYDNMVLPLVSPDGRFIATQTRIAPTWPTILAEFDAEVPYATRIEIYTLPEGVSSPLLVTELDEPALLGRSFDERGFLIEAPQEDGSRWIGYVEWETGALTWLVADEFVNAFPSLGSDGRLAWSRRPIDVDDDSHFDLVIRTGEAEWSVESPTESWLMPTWSGRGDGLFVLSLADGRLEAVYAVASDMAAFRQSRHRLPLAIEAGIFSAYQTIGAQTCGPGGTGYHGSPAREAFIFFHPSQMRMAIWQPRTGGHRAGVSMLDRLSYAALMHDAEHVIVSMENVLLLRHVQRERDRSELIAGMHVPRPTPHSADWPYILVSPEDGEVAIIPMRPLQPRDLSR